VFVASADGLAAGNTQAEAVLHALYEVLARDSVAAAHALGEPAEVDPATVDCDDARRLLDRLVAAGLRVRILDTTGPTGVAAFEVVATAPGQVVAARGSACHLDRDVALCRALANAVRERMALVSGARDDVPVAGLDADAVADQSAAGAAPLSPAPRRAYADVPTLSTSNFAGDIAEVSDRIRRSGVGPVLVVDLTREEVGLPVVRVVVPGLRHLDQS
jgi:YcaO-like protein with predicted kinase domain